MGQSGETGKAQGIGIVGGGWAGCAAAALLTARGHAVTLLEAAPMLGGRARTLETLGSPEPLDNGQHIAIGAYADTLALLQSLGVAEGDAFHRMPFNLQRADGTGLRFPDLPAPWNALLGIFGAKGWSWGDRLALLRWAAAWQIKGFRCAADLKLAQITQGLPRKVQEQFITPLCLSALNTAVHEASAQVFLRVLRDAMFLFPQGSDFLLPKQDLGALLPQAVARAVQAAGGQLHSGQRVLALQKQGAAWQVQTAEENWVFSKILLATPAWAAADLLAPLAAEFQLQGTVTALNSLQYRAIATVYARSSQPLPAPMLALADSAAHPAQFVFDRSQLLPKSGQQSGALLAFVISLCQLPQRQLEAAVLQQAKTQLGLDLQPVQTVVEKRATIAATPAAFAAKAQMPAYLGQGLYLAGDYLHPVYPSTLEGAVQSAQSAVAALLSDL